MYASAIALAWLLGTSAELPAQTLRGRLLDERSGAPVAAAFVILRDSTGRQVTAFLADTAGRFQTVAPRAGSYSLRVERIGYRTFETEPIALAADALVVREIRLPEQAIVLPSVDATAARRCTGARELAAAAATIWEEARKALSVAAWTGRSGTITYEVQETRRELDVNLRQIRQHVRPTEIPATRSPYRSVPAAELASEGYVRPERGDFLYFGPDADVLLSDEFLEAHCFRAANDPSGRNLVGLEFEPVTLRNGLHDIRGVLWLDRTTYELRHVDFRYATLPFTTAAEQAGGQVQFRRLPGFGWIVDEWWIRMPIVRRLLGNAQVDAQFVQGYDETARVVLSATAPDGTLIPLRRR